MNTLSERIKAVMNISGDTVTSLAQIAGVKPPSVSDWLNGKTKTLKAAPAARIAKHFGVNILWLTDGFGTMRQVLPSSDTQIELKGAESNAEEGPALGRFRNVPVVGTAQLGDNGYWAELETPVGFGDGYIPFPTKSGSAYALRCRGDSMKPRIKNGEFVIVDPSLCPAPGDEVLIRSSDGRVMVKELLYVRDDQVHLLSVNEAHGKMTIPLADIEIMHGVAGIMPPHAWEKG